MGPHLLIAVALSTLIGVSLGFFGGGGSILAVPLLVYVARVDVHAAIGMSLAVVGATSLGGALVHARAGRVDARAAAAFGIAGMIGAALGARATHAVGPRTLLLLFAALLIVVGALMLREAPAWRTAPRGPARHAAIVVAGVLTGLLTGFLGVGGGFLVVPALTLLGGLPIHRAVGTSLLVIALTSAAGFAGHVGRGLPAGLTATFATASLLGALVGVRVAAATDPRRLRRSFAGLVLAVGLALLAVNV